MILPSESDAPSGRSIRSVPETRARVVLYDVVSGNNDYSVELAHALAAIRPLHVVTVDNTRIRRSPRLHLWPWVPAVAKPRPRWQKLLQQLGAYLALAALCLRSPRHTVLHVQFLRFERVEAVLFGLLQRLGVRVMFTAHNALPHMPKPWHRSFYRQWLARCDAVQTLTQSVLDEIEGPMGVKLRAKVVIGHGPYETLRRDYGGLDREACRTALGLPADRLLVLQFGLMKPYKGVDRLVEAMAMLPPERRPFLVLAGDGPAEYLDPIERRIAETGIPSRWFRRHLSNEDLCRLLVVADVTVYPYNKVSQSGALYLGMTFGKPCLCSDLPGFREALSSGDSSFVPAADTAAWTERLGRLVGDPSELQVLAQEVEVANATGFAWPAIAERTWQAYDDLVSGRPSIDRPTEARRP